ncbi:hypothetical protein SprV_0301223500 [Sparganum proliferum]
MTKSSKFEAKRVAGMAKTATPAPVTASALISRSGGVKEQSEEQPTGTEDGASGPRTGALQGGHRRTQRDPILRRRPPGEVGAGYTFFWSGRPRTERRDAGVAFAIRNDIVGRLPCLPQGINDRLMSLTG